ncbi:MAG: M23 family metallopeptidase [Peptococcaceae bacterium]|nr:M23 family metallopeptidase [Peptococcaceae bacterium]
MGVHAGKYGLAYPVPNCTGISAFTYPGHTNHARDFQPPGNAWGTPIVSVLDGVVQTAGYHWSYGNNVYIDHGNGWMSRYAHLQSLNVRAGQGVKKGQVVGGCGSTGDSTGLHLHMELHTPWGWADPGPFFSSYGYCYLTGSE